MHTGVSHHRIALRELMNGRAAKFIGLCHRARRSICIGQIAARKIRLAGLAPHLRHRCRDPLLQFRRRIIGEGVAEILHNIQPVSAAHHAQPDNVISRVEQVGSMRRRQHQMFVPAFGVEIERDVFAFLIQLCTSRGRQASG